MEIWSLDLNRLKIYNIYIKKNQNLNKLIFIAKKQSKDYA